MSDTHANPALLTFPCPFPLKVMGLAQDGFAPAVLDIVRCHAPDFAPEHMQMRPSRGGKYLALTCTLNATSQAQLDALYRELSAHPWVKVVL